MQKYNTDLANMIIVGRTHGEQREKAHTFTPHTLSTQRISWVYMASDGFQDQFGGKQNKKFGVARFRELLSQHHTKSENEQASLLQDIFLAWREEGQEKQIDDVLVVGLKLLSYNA